MRGNKRRCILGGDPTAARRAPDQFAPSHVSTPDGPLRIPAHARGAIERATRSDRAFFRNNPSAISRVRPIVPGEEWPKSLDGETHVLAVRLSDTHFARCFKVGAE